MLWPNNSTTLAVGDVFVFRGLGGQDVPDGTGVVIDDVSPTGTLSVRVVQLRGATDEFVEKFGGREQVPYSEAVRLVEERIWLPEDNPYVRIERERRGGNLSAPVRKAT